MDFSKYVFDIVIEGGQSNAEGWGRGPVTEEFIPSPNCFYMEPNKSVVRIGDELKITYFEPIYNIVPAEEKIIEGLKVGDLSLTFAKKYEEEFLQSNRKLLIIRAAACGTGFAQKHWGLGKILHNKLVDLVNYALSMNKENRVVAFLWHQGEHEAYESIDPNVFEALLKETFIDIRNRYGNMPIIAGDFVRDWKDQNKESCDRVISKIKNVLKDIKNSSFVETSDLLSNNEVLKNGDGIHFSRESLHILGYRYFDEYKKLR